MAARQYTCHISRREWSESLNSIPPYWLGKTMRNNYLSCLSDNLLSDLSEYLKVESTAKVEKVTRRLGPVYRFSCGPVDVSCIAVEFLLSFIVGCFLYYLILH